MSEAAKKVGIDEKILCCHLNTEKEGKLLKVRGQLSRTLCYTADR